MAIKPFGLLDTSNVNVIILSSATRISTLTAACSYYKEEHCQHNALFNLQTFLLADEHIPSASIQLGILTMVKMEFHRDMPVLG